MNCIRVAVALLGVPALARDFKLGYLQIWGGPGADNGWSDSWIQESFSQFKLGIKDVNANASILGGHTLSFDLRDTQGNEGIALDGAISMLAEGVVGLVGTAYTSAASASAVYASNLKKPMVSPGSTGINLIDKSRFPFFMRSIPSDAGMLKAMAALPVQFGWAKAALLVNSAYENGAIQVLRPALEAQKIGYLMLVYADTVDSKSVVIPENLARLDEQAKLIRTAGYRIILTYPKTIDVANLNSTTAANGIGFRSPAYVWVVTNGAWTGPLQFEPQVLCPLAGTPPSGRAAWYNARWPSVTTRFNASIHPGYNSTTGLPFFGSANQSQIIWDTDYAPLGDLQPDFWGTYCYDAVWLYAYAIKSMLAAGKDPATDGTGLRDALLRTRFEGVTGDLYFDQSSQDRMLPITIYLSSNGAAAPMVIGMGTDNLTSWAMSGPCVGCTTIVPSTVPWPAGIGKTPTDGRLIDVDRTALVVADVPYQEGSPIVFSVQALDSFSRAPCLDACPGGNRTAQCTSCLAMFANIQQITFKLQDASSNATLMPEANATFMQDILSGKVDVTLPKGVAGASSNDRAVVVSFSFQGRAVGGSRTLSLRSLACAAGQEGSSGSCTRCSPGTFAGTRGLKQCLPCAPGSHVSTMGATACQMCDLGRFAAAAGMSDCLACEVATYADTAGQSSCEQCGAGHLTTLQKVMIQGAPAWVPSAGSANESACVCDKGTRPMGDHCEVCGEGLECRGNDDVYIQAGYNSEADLSIWQCYGDIQRCPGGYPGQTCAAGRTGISCAECQPGKSPAKDGTCVDCDSPSVLPSVFSFLAWLMVMGVVYYSQDRQQSKTSPSHAVLLVTISCGQFIALVQQLAVLGMFQIEWHEPLRTAFQIGRLFTFDIEVLKPGCVTTLNATGRFFFKIGFIVVNLVLMCLVHAVSVIVLYKRQFRQQQPVLVGVLGTVLMVYYISIVGTVLGPLQCTKSPNGLWTSRAYQGVACFNKAISPEHVAMVTVGIIMLLVPIAFLSNCVRAVLLFPAKMKQLDARFFKAYQFMFYRVRPQTHWYALVLMGRSFLIALAPVFPNVVAQLFIIQFVLLVCFGVTTSYMPWRVPIANFLDYVATGMMLLVASGATFFANRVDPDSIGWLYTVIIMGGLLVLPAVVLFMSYKNLLRRTKALQFMVCHHKAGAGAFARVVKYRLVEELKGEGNQVLLDSEYPGDLDHLFDTVGNKVGKLVVVGSTEVFLRPACVGQVTVAWQKGVPVDMLALPDYVPPSNDFIEHYEDLVKDLQRVAETGITLARIKDMLRWARDLPAIDVPPVLNAAVFRALVEKLNGKVTSASVLDDPGSTSAVILADSHNVESSAAGNLLRLFLQPHFGTTLGPAPKVVHTMAEIQQSSSTRYVVLICTSGCLMHAGYLQAMVAASDLQVQFVPVVSDAKFRFPTKEVLEQLRAHPPVLPDLPQVNKGEFLVKVVAEAFASIAIGFDAQESAEEALMNGSLQIAARLLGKASKSLSVSYESASVSRRTLALPDGGAPVKPDGEQGGALPLRLVTHVTV